MKDSKSSQSDIDNSVGKSIKIKNKTAEQHQALLKAAVRQNLAGINDWQKVIKIAEKSANLK